MIVDKELHNLKHLTIQKDYISIKNILNNYSLIHKGLLFELYLKELYEGNNWIVKYEGGKNDGGADLLLIHPDNPETILEIIQAKNHKKPLNYNDTRSELRKFEEISSVKYNSNHFKIISLNGFVKTVDEYTKINDLKNFNLYLAEWMYIKELINNYEPDISKRTNKPNIKLFAHNQVAYEQIHKEWIKNKRVAVVQATGTGKTYIIAKILSDFINKKTLVLAPSNYIINEIENKTSWILNNVMFMTYASLQKKHDISSLKFDLIILDEFHRVGAEEWGKAVHRVLSYNPNCKVLGTSATPIRYSDGKNMIKELFQKKIKQEISLSYAIIHNILAMPEYIAAMYTLEDEINVLKEKLSKSLLSEQEKSNYYNNLKEIELNWTRTNGVANIFKKYLNKDKNKFIVFCENEGHLKKMEGLVLQWFNETNLYKKVKIYSVFNSYGYSNNISELKEFKNNSAKDTAKILLSIDMLNEGIHFSDIDGVIFLRNTKSHIIYHQQLGRALSVNGKTPIVFDFVNNFANISSNNFLNDLKREKNIFNKKRNLHNLTKQDFTYKIFDESKNIFDILKKIDINALDWNVRFNELKKYFLENGHSNVPYTDKINTDLASWVYAQRKNYKNNNLSSEQLSLLKQVNFKFSFDNFEIWKEKYNLLVDFYNKNGHSNISDLQNHGLYVWTQYQRLCFKNGNLSKQQINLLNQIKFKFNLFDKWKEKYDLLVEFYNENGHSNVPSYTFNNKTLTSWVVRQRQLYRDNKLSEERISLLQMLNFKFSFDNFELWKEKYDLAVEFYNNNGHSNIIKRYKDNPSLGIWIDTQRKNFRNNNLSTEQISLLKEIDFKFKVK